MKPYYFQWFWIGFIYVYSRNLFLLWTSVMGSLYFFFCIDSTVATGTDNTHTLKSKKSKHNFFLQNHTMYTNKMGYSQTKNFTSSWRVAPHTKMQHSWSSLLALSAQDMTPISPIITHFCASSIAGQYYLAREQGYKRGQLLHLATLPGQWPHKVIYLGSVT